VAEAGTGNKTFEYPNIGIYITTLPDGRWMVDSKTSNLTGINHGTDFIEKADIVQANDTNVPVRVLNEYVIKVVNMEPSLVPNDTDTL
jgi:hypothetical protein